MIDEYRRWEQEEKDRGRRVADRARGLRRPRMTASELRKERELIDTTPTQVECCTDEKSGRGRTVKDKSNKPQVSGTSVLIELVNKPAYFLHERCLAKPQFERLAEDEQSRDAVLLRLYEQARVQVRLDEDLCSSSSSSSSS